MPEAYTSPHRRALWLTIGLFGLVAVATVLFFAFLETRERFQVSPNTVRPWEEATWRKRFDPAAHLTLPTISSDPVPALTVTNTSGELEITGSPGHDDSLDTYYEIFEEDAAGVVTLPDGNLLELAAVAVVLPSDVEREETTRYARLRPDWIDPKTGEPIPRQPGKPWTEKEQGLPNQKPRLHLRVRRSGSLAPLRWHFPRVHDERTLRNVGSTASHSNATTDGEFWVELEQWHHAPLRIGVQFAFGTPEEKTIPAEKGAVAEFGDDGRIELLGILANGHSSSSWGGNGSSFNVSFGKETAPSKSRERSFIFQVWPRNNQQQAEVFPVDSESGRMLTGNYGISGVEFWKEDAASPEFRIRRYPRLGRAVFALPVVPRLPEASNLFEVPIPWVRIDYPSQFVRTITDATGTRSRFRHRNELPSSLFPMEFTDVTPAELIEKYEQLTGSRLYFDETTLELTDERPPGPFQGIKDWWEKNQPGWWP